MCGLDINIASFVHLLKKVDFNAIVDHLALTHIIKSKTDLTTTKIKRLLEILSSYSFNLYHINGEDMIPVTSYQYKSMVIANHMKSYPFHSTSKVYYKLGIIIKAKEIKGST